MSSLNLSEHVALDRAQWGKNIHAVNPNSLLGYKARFCLVRIYSRFGSKLFDIDALMKAFDSIFLPLGWFVLMTNLEWAVLSSY